MAQLPHFLHLPQPILVEKKTVRGPSYVGVQSAIPFPLNRPIVRKKRDLSKCSDGPCPVHMSPELCLSIFSPYPSQMVFGFETLITRPQSDLSPVDPTPE